MEKFRKTKIVATLGKASSSKEQLKKLIQEGVDAVRISSRFLEMEQRDSVLSNLRQAEQEVGKQICVILSLRESDIRLGSANAGTPMVLCEGDVVKIVSDPPKTPEPKTILCNNREFPNLVKEGDELLLEYGKVLLTVVKVEEHKSGISTPLSSSQGDLTSLSSLPVPSASESVKRERLVSHNSQNNVVRFRRTKPKGLKSFKLVYARVENDCKFDNQTPMNFSNANFLDPEKYSNDLEDIKLLEWSGSADIDIIVYKQIRGREDLETLWNFRTPPNVKRFVGIQTKESANSCEEFIDVSDGCSIGRGVLGLETSLPNVCKIQKYVTKVCNEKGKPVMVSTQVLESMVFKTKPSRAEVTGVFNVVYDGIDSILLTGETAYGKHPELAVRACASICMEAEKHIPYEEVSENILKNIQAPISIPENICYCAVRSVLSIKAKLIVCITKTGKTAQLISRFKPPCMILAITNSTKALKYMRIIRGVYPACLEEAKLTESFKEHSMKVALEKELVQSGDKVIYVGGGHDSFIEGDTSSLVVCIIP